MAELTLEVARKILDVALAKGVEKKLKPLVVTVLDARGCVKISAAQDGTSLLRSEIIINLSAAKNHTLHRSRLCLRIINHFLESTFAEVCKF